MLTSKTFVKKTRKGSILKVVREHYLRDDIWCGSELCSKCPKNGKDVLELNPQNISSLCQTSHYILPDTNVFIHQMDVLEHSAIKNVIVLQTVLEELRHRNSPIYKRVKEIISVPNRHFYTFSNEHHRDTYLEREAGESANDRNDRAIRAATKWYNDHLDQNGNDLVPVFVLLLTNDRNNKNKAIDDGLVAFTIDDYVRSVKDYPELVDKLALLESEIKDNDMFMKTGDLFPEHLSLAQIHSGIKAGKYFQGTFYTSRENYCEATVSLHDSEKMVLIKGQRNMNRAVLDDVVTVEIFPEEKWTEPSALILEDTKNDPEEDQLMEDVEEEKVVSKAEDKKVPTGKVVGIIKRNWRQYCGILKPSHLKESTRHLFVAAEKRIPKIRIETRQAAILKSHRIVVTIDSWPKHSRYPQGHFIKKLGEIGDKDTENEVILLEHDVPHDNFSEAVNACLPKLPWIITENDVAVREDLRHICICSVDPPGCTDIDDALHCRNLENGNYEVGVHIADVSHFIRPGTAIDNEASSRGTTVYLVDKRIDMVPDLLSSNLCSLRGNEERFAFSCIWEMTPDTEIISTHYTKSIIKSKAALTYAEAQLKIDDKSLNDQLTLSLRGLNSLAKILKQKRIDAGALTLASSEIRFSIDSETHDPIDVQSKEIRETNSMVEEFMLLANVSVAKKILDEFPDCACLRRHPAPPLSNYDPLIIAAKSKSFELEINSNKGLADSLDQASLPQEPFFNTLLRMLATRCMMQAVYFCSGMVAAEDYYHYGLAASVYTHFTSPIRRYSDIIVHRLLAAAIGADKTYSSLLDKKKIQTVCNNLNYRHRMAQYAGRSSVGLHTQLFFKERVLDVEGYVLFVRKNAIQVLIPKFGLEGTLYLTSWDKKAEPGPFVYNEKECCQVAGDVTLSLFDRLIVQLSIDRTDVQHQKLKIHLVHPVVTGFSIAASESSEPPEKKRKH